MINIIQVVTHQHIQQAQGLFAEYFEFIRTDVDKVVDDLDDVPPLAGYREELAGLPGRYTPPNGRLLLALEGDVPAGCVAYHKLEPNVCELKRLWVSPQFRGQGISRMLVEALIREALQSGYRAIVLSTVDILKPAIALYESLGFKVTAPYFDMPEAMLEHEIFMRIEFW